MTKCFAWGLLALSLSVFPASAQQTACMRAGCGPVSFKLSSVSDHIRYGLLVRSPADSLCQSVQFVVAANAGAAILGRSRLLQPGEVQVVRIGAGFAAGDHPLRITAAGCAVQPVGMRRVRLGKPSPDHGWRASAFVQAYFTP